MSKNIFKTFVRSYLDKLNKTIIPYQYKATKELYENVSIFVEEYVKQHPNTANAIFGNGVIATTFENNMSHLSDIFNIFSHLDMSTMDSKMTDVPYIINNVIQDIDSVTTHDNINDNDVRVMKDNIFKYMNGKQIDYILNNYKYTNTEFNIKDPIYGKLVKDITIDELLLKIENNKLYLYNDPYGQELLRNVNEYKNKKMTIKDFVGRYNDIISNLAERHDLPSKYFIGKYVKTICNNIFIADHNIVDKLRVLRHIINSDYGSRASDAAFDDIIFYILVITNQIFTSEYVVYEYMTKNIATFYANIMKSIIDDDITFFKNYYTVTISKLYDFMNQMASMLNVNDRINIRKCDGEIASRFLLFNYFKPLLDHYNASKSDTISIYARINNIDNTSNKMFTTNDNKTLHISPKLATDINTIEFTKILDSTQYPDNGDISKYMLLDTHLSQGTGQAIITLGYSGVGKTYTLFGNDGMLQSTLNNISNLKYIKFCLFEINGLNHEIYHYDIVPTKSDLKIKNVNVIKPDQTKQFVENDTKYVTISNVLISDVFKNYNKFMRDIDMIRNREKRNGNIMIYDFRLGIGLQSDPNGDKEVALILIDLPNIHKNKDMMELIKYIISRDLGESIMVNILKSYFDVIKNYKFLYLLGNYEDENRIEYNHQYDLLKEMKSLIDAIMQINKH